MKATDGQIFATRKLLGFIKVRDARLWVLSQLIERDLSSTSDLMQDEWRKIRDSAYPNWTHDDWGVCSEFKSKCLSLNARWEEEILGQATLF